MRTSRALDARRVAATLLIISLSVSSAAAAAEPEDELALDDVLLGEVLEILADRYVDDEALTSENLTLGAIRGIVEALGDDGHTLYLTADELRIEEDALDGRVVGIGIVVDRRAGSPRIISVVDDSPADRAGLQAGDVIASIDGADTTRIPVHDIAELVRGDVGTNVTLGIERPGERARLDVRITRDDVKIVPVTLAFVPGSDVAVLRIVQFSSGAGRGARSAIEDALEAGATGFVLDLRGNPGGLVDEALIVISSFLRQGVAYQEQGRHGPPRDVHVTGSWTIAADVPLVVLVDYGTASSAEIVAVALRDNDRAIVVGEPTFGTGTVLNTFDLSDGSALRLGVLNWLSPEGEVVFRVGVAPDELVELPIGAVALEPGDLLGMTAIEFADSDDVPLRHAVRILEAELTT